MKYNLEEIPYISELYSYQNDEINQRVLCSADGQIKIINCSPKLLEEVLLYVDGINSFGMIEDNFKSRYSKEEVRLFLKTILNEGIVSLKDIICQVKLENLFPNTFSKNTSNGV